MKWSIRCLTGVAPLISALSTASARTWSYGDYGPRAKGCYETPYDGGPQYGSDGGDQYGPSGAQLLLPSPLPVLGRHSSAPSNP